MALVISDDFRAGVKPGPAGTVQLVFEDVLFRSEDDSLELTGDKQVFIIQPEVWEELKKRGDQVLKDQEAQGLEVPELEVVRDMKEATDGQTKPPDSNPS